VTALVPAPSWAPPLDTSALADVLEKLRRWTPYDDDALLEDVGAVLDDFVPSKDDVEGHAQRLRAHLVRLESIAVAQGASQRDPEADRLVRQARDVRAEELPAGHMAAVGHVRRLAWSVHELLERLTAIKCVREAA